MGGAGVGILHRHVDAIDAVAGITPLQAAALDFLGIGGAAGKDPVVEIPQLVDRVRRRGAPVAAPGLDGVEPNVVEFRGLGL